MPFTFCKISVNVLGTFEIRSQTYIDTVPDIWTPRWGAKGKFEEYTFVGEIDTAFHDANTSGTMKITLDPNSLEIISIDAGAKSTYPGAVSTWGIKLKPGVKFPVKDSSEYILEYGASGYEACNYLGPLYYTDTRENSSDTLLNYNCHETSEFHIEFR